MPEIKNMSFQTNHATKLKTAIGAVSLCNSTGMGYVEVDPNNGFKISSISDTNSGLISFMCLEPSKLVNFSCVNPIKKKMVNLKFLLRLLQAFDEESITFFQENDGRSCLSFEAVSAPGIQLGVGLLDNTDFEAYSGTMSHTTEATLSTEVLKTMIPEMVKGGGSQLVTADTTLEETKLLINAKKWEFKSSKENAESAGTESELKHHVDFLWPQVDSLKKASSLTEQCSFALLSSNDVMLQFQFEEGSLVYINRPLPHTTQ